MSIKWEDAFAGYYEVANFMLFILESKCATKMSSSAIIDYLEMAI